MGDATETYQDATRALERIADRCHGLIADVTERHDALLDWQASIAAGADPEAIDTALRNFFAGEPPGWISVRAALSDWIAATHVAERSWHALSEDEQARLTPPCIRLLADEPGTSEPEF